MRSSAIRRFGSYFIDNILLSLIGIFLIGFVMEPMMELIDISYQAELGTITMAEYWREYSRLMLRITLITGIPQFIIGIIYSVVLPLYWDGKTVGRHIAGVQLKNQDEEPLRFWTLFVREVVFKMIWWTVTLGIGSIVDFIMVAVRKDKLTIRDIVTRTQVVDLDGESVKKEYKDF